MTNRHVDAVLALADEVLEPAPAPPPKPRQQFTIRVAAPDHCFEALELLVTEWPAGELEVDVRYDDDHLWSPIEQWGGTVRREAA